MGQKAGTRPPMLNGEHGRRNLQNPIAMPTGELRADRPDDLEPRRDVFQGLGNVLADLPQPTATLMAGVTRAENYLFARQMIRQRPALRLDLGKFCLAADIGCLWRFRARRLDVFEHQLQLLNHMVEGFGLRAEAMPSEIGKLQLQLLDQQVFRANLGIPLGEKLKQRGTVWSGGCDDLNHRHESYSSTGSS